MVLTERLRASGGGPLMLQGLLLRGASSMRCGRGGGSSAPLPVPWPVPALEAAGTLGVGWFDSTWLARPVA